MSPTGQPLYIRLPALIIVGAIALVGASCGGTTFPSSLGTSSTTTTAALTKAEYVARANTLCAAGNARNDAIGDPGGDPKTQADAVDAGAVIVADTLRQLRSLPVPEGDAASVASIYANVDKIIKDAARLSAALRAGHLATARQIEEDVQADESAANAAANAYGLTVCGSSSDGSAPTTTTTTTPAPSPAAFPKVEVTPGENNISESGFKPLFEVRGTGSQMSPPLDLSTTCLTGAVENDGWVKVSIAPAGQTSPDATVQYYTNDAGDGGASASLALPGKYVVIVEAINPNVHWTVDIADKGSVYRCSPTFAVTPGQNNAFSGGSKPLFEIRGTGSRTSPPLDFPTKCLIGGVENDGWVKVSIAPAAQPSADTAIEYYTNGSGDGGAQARLPQPGKYVVIVETTKSNVHWTVDIADASPCPSA